MKYRYLFFDMDNILFDFDADEDQALTQLFEKQQVALTPTLKADYQAFNQALWVQYEQGTLKREALLNTRFATFFKQALNLTVDGPTLSHQYLASLALGHDLMPQSQQLMTALAQTDAELYVTTNGVAHTQYQRLIDSQFKSYFKGIFISEELGYQKPDPAYFEKVFQQIEDIDLTQALIVGDSLTSDVQGGQNVGVDTAWYNPNGAVNTSSTIKPTHEIKELLALLAM